MNYNVEIYVDDIYVKTIYGIEADHEYDAEDMVKEVTEVGYMAIPND
jgi:hypothetical protein